MKEPLSSPWLRSKAWDGFWLLSGVWLLPVIVLLQVVPTALLAFSLAATAVLWLSHRMATFFNIYFTQSYQELIWKEPLRFIVVPLAIIVGTLCFQLFPSPLSPLTRVQILGTIFFLFNSYHFGVQHFGVLTIYRIRANQKLTEEQRLLERRSCLLLGGVLVAIGQLLHGSDVIRESLLLDLSIDAFSGVVRGLGVASVLAVGALLFRQELNQTSRSAPKLIYEGGLIAQSLAAFLLPALPFLVLWGVQHWLVSIGLSIHMAEGDAHGGVESRSRWFRFWKSKTKSLIVTALFLFTCSILVSPLLLFPTKALSGTLPDTPQLLYEILAWCKEHEQLALGLVALNFGTVFCHFVFDRAVFRFSHPDVRRVSGGLLFGKRPNPPAA